MWPPKIIINKNKTKKKIGSFNLISDGNALCSAGRGRKEAKAGTAVCRPYPCPPTWSAILAVNLDLKSIKDMISAAKVYTHLKEYFTRSITSVRVQLGLALQLYLS